MSPEQLAGDKLDGRSDIYSLGLVAFNMLTGKLPFPSDSQQESMIMRLTDKPKGLGEMKSDRSWPADVQAVMDKALERDAGVRYQHATEFGMALYNAIQRMPETVAAEMGTAVMGAVPPTRVSAGPAASSQGATVAVPTPPVSSPPVARGTASAKKRSNVPLMAGAAAVVVIGAIAAKLAMGKPTAPTNSIDSLSKPAPAAASVDQTLTQLESDATVDAKADTVLAALRAIVPTNADDKARVNFIRFKAFTTKKDDVKACIAIKAALQDVSDPTLKDKFTQRAAGCGIS
jgi:serine/threonine-protein kinase